MKKHEHGGRSSSREVLDAGKVVRLAGIKEGEAVADVGSGNGYFSLAAAQLVGPQGKVFALDVDEAALTVLRAAADTLGYARLRTVVADAQKLPLKDASVDVVFMANVMHGFVANEEDCRVLDEAARVLRPGGSLVVVDYKKMDTPSGPPQDIRLSPEETEAAAAHHGFIRAALEEAGPYHYLMRFTHP